MRNLFISFLLLLAGVNTDAVARTLLVTSSADIGTGSLRVAIAEAQDGDVIFFDLPDGQQTIILRSELHITGKSLTINGQCTDPETRIVLQVPQPGVSTFRIFRIETEPGQQVMLIDLELRGGDVSMEAQDAEGGVVLLRGSGTLTMAHCIIRDGRARQGGGVYAGGLFSEGSLALWNCDVTRNTADAPNGEAAGGGLYACLGRAVLYESRIIDNHSSSHSAGFYIHNARSSIFRSLIAGNLSADGSVAEGSLSGPTLRINQSDRPRIYLANLTDQRERALPASTDAQE